MDASSINTVDLSPFREVFRKYVEEQSQKTVSNSNIVLAVYDSTRYVRYFKQLRLKEVAEGIRNASERKNTIKENLSVAYFSVKRFNGRKENVNVVEHTGLIVIDIDIKDNPGMDFIRLKQDLIKDKYTCMCFTSPSGGIKVAINTNIHAKEHHIAYFESIKQYFLTKYNIIKIDPSGCNIARACYLPYDTGCYLNSSSYRYWLCEDDINRINAEVITKNLNLPKVLLQVDSISSDEHFDNMFNLLEKWTEVGMYPHIFNKYRFFNIDRYNIKDRGVMSTSVQFFEILIGRNMYPYRLDWSTQLDEKYFADDIHKPLSTDSLEGIEGLEVCEIVLPKGHIIKEGFRGMTLASISMKLIFNNPFCHIDNIIQVVSRINDIYCEDPHLYHRPKPDFEEVSKIVIYNYTRFLAGELDFSSVIRKKTKNGKISKKYVFWSRQHKAIDGKSKQLEATKTYHEGRNAKKHTKFIEAVHVLQNGKKITNKRIAECTGVSCKTIARFRKDITEFDGLINDYNAKIRSKG